MPPSVTLTRQLRERAEEADALHLRSRELLVSAARAGHLGGLTQREIADALGRSQPEVSRLLRFRGRTELGRRLASRRAEVIRILRDLGARRPRVFGSVARGTDEAGSDVDLLVDLDSGVSLFAIARAELDLAAILEADVDIVPASALRPNVAASVVRDAVPL
ncbi:nucleotidyltransferase domain-containing protein [Pseudolysinimonas sp.]|uniref:nucleotidyltransferase domain-containing protein n=1 Tax=Pseudolysinimonas sp. TaxID=2680009 RepID=UPI00378372DF